MFSADRQTDKQTLVKQYASDLSMQGHKNLILVLINAFAGNKFKKDQMAIQVLYTVENTVRKRENAGFQHFFPLSSMFSDDSF